MEDDEEEDVFEIRAPYTKKDEQEVFSSLGPQGSHSGAEPRRKLDPSTIVPVDSFLALRKAISCMKDVGFFVSLSLFKPTELHISIVDDFFSTGILVPLPVVDTTNFVQDVPCYVPVSELVSLSNLLKEFSVAIRVWFVMQSKSVRVETAFSSQRAHRVLLHQKCLFPSNILIPRRAEAIDKQMFYWIEMISQDFLKIMVNLSVGSAVMDVILTSDGMLTFRNNHELGETIVEKQLNVRFLGLPAGSVGKRVLCHITCVPKFIKQIVNGLVNNSQKTSFLGLPKYNYVRATKHGTLSDTGGAAGGGVGSDRNLRSDPLMLKFLLTKTPETWEYFIMYPYNEPLQHQWSFPTQQPLQYACTSRSTEKRKFLSLGSGGGGGGAQQGPPVIVVN